MHATRITFILAGLLLPLIGPLSAAEAAPSNPGTPPAQRTSALVDRNQAVAKVADRACVTSGGYGGARFKKLTGPVTKLKVTLWAYDGVSDGQHVRVRLVTKNSKGQRHYWKWHKTSSEKTWHTTARDVYGIFEVGAQVAQFKGDRRLDMCTAWK
ncbi:hypothetical protein [Streptomyces sp. NPDC048611]|uniref:hypothetical protein n=1 Tax=Streptomyces sp. NPDC048611 TaxID=3155635 RepID=UPI003412465F